MTIGGQSLSQALEETIHQADKLTRRHIQKLAVLLPLQQDGTHFYDPLQRDKRSLAAKIPEQNTTSYRKEKIREAMRPLNLQSHRMEHVATLK